MKDITPERWQRIEELLDGALDREPATRNAWLDEACGDDAELRRSVGALLDAGDEAGTFLEADGPRPVANFRNAVLRVREQRQAEKEFVGRQIGPYRVIRRLGKGGMGQVFLAVRDDQSFTRHVALKLIRQGLDTEEILHRFRTEQRILGSLSHPNIARLLDAGAEQGLSYLVMEYIEGVPITKYCEANGLSVRERLELFRGVCGAVHYAHQNLVVHRDLKPGNILVSSDGVPRLLDFGIAKVLNPNLPGVAMPMTRPEVRVMTPEYASPEQMRGMTVTTASDVYQLGVLLYELLTGSRPYRTAGLTRDQIERLVCDSEPERPSTAVMTAAPETLDSGAVPELTPAASRGGRLGRLRRMLEGDLDRIVLMALRKEPTRRYQSVDQLQEDVRRYLEGLPVRAQSDTWAYRTAKFVRRHRVSVAASATAAVLLVVLSVIALRFAVLTRAQAERVQTAAARTEQVRQFLINLFEVADPENARGRQVTARELLEEGAARVERELAGQPDVQAEMLSVIGTVYRQLGLYDEAQPFLERSLAMRRSLYGPTHPEVAASLFELGELRVWQGHLGNAEDLHREALDIRRSTLAARDPLVAASLNGLGVVVAERGRYDEAEVLFREALAIREQALGESDAAVAETIANLAWVLHDDGHLDEAEGQYRRAIAIQRRVLGEDHPDVATTTNNLAALLFDTGNYAAAEPLFREVLDLRTRLYGAGHPLVTNAKSWLGRVLQQQGKTDEAEERFREALADHRSQLGDRHMYVGRDLHILGDLLAATGRYAEAESSLIEALSIYRDNLDSPDHRLIQEARATLSQVYTDWGRPDRSAAY
jgi:serine/threonine-protein kinase